MPNVLQSFAGSTTVTISVAALLTATARESNAVDNTTNKYLDALVYVALKLQTGTPSSDKATFVYAYGSEDGTNYTDNATGSDAAITLRDPTNLRHIGTISMPDVGALTYKSHPMSIAAAFGGIMPRKWGIVIQNRSGVSYSTVEGDHTKTYTGISGLIE
jgi:hypothetical protein